MDALRPITNSPSCRSKSPMQGTMERKPASTKARTLGSPVSALPPRRDPQKTISVCLRVRPLGEGQGRGCIEYVNDQEIKVVGHKFADDEKSEMCEKRFQFSQVFGEKTTQEVIYNEVAAATVEDVFKGYHGIIFCYGQTGSGKTHTLCNCNLGEEGIIPRSVKDIFRRVDKEQDKDFGIELVMVQIYQEQIFDLLGAQRDSPVTLRDDPEIENGVSLDGVQSHKVSSYNQCIALYLKGEERRAVASTRCNDRSSRSHTVFLLNVTSKKKKVDGEDVDETMLRGRLIVVDLAGSERVKRSGAEGSRLEEAKFINKSLMILGRVVQVLTEPNPLHIPIRDSKLTRLLGYALLGHGKTSIIVTCNPQNDNTEECVSTCNFGQRAMKIKQQAKIHETIDYKALCATLKAMMADRDRVLREEIHEEYKAEIDALKERLAEYEGKTPTTGPAYRSEYPTIVVEDTSVDHDPDHEKTRRQIEGITHALDDICGYCRDLLNKQGTGGEIGPLQLKHINDRVLQAQQLVIKNGQGINAYFTDSLAQLSERTAALQALQEKYDTLNEEAEKYKCQCDTLVSNFRAAKAEAESVQSENTNNWLSQLDTLSQELAKSKIDCSRHEAAASELNETVKGLTVANEDLELECLDLQTQLEKLASDYQNAMEGGELTGEELHKLKEHSEKLQEANTRYEEEVRKLKQSCERFGVEKEEMCNMLTEVERERDAYIERYSIVENNLKNSDTREKDLEDMNRYLAEELEALQNYNYAKSKKKTKTLFKSEENVKFKDLIKHKKLRHNEIALVHDDGKDKHEEEKEKEAEVEKEKKSIWRGIINKSRSGKGVSVVFTDLEMKENTPAAADIKAQSGSHQRSRTVVNAVTSPQIGTITRAHMYDGGVPSPFSPQFHQSHHLQSPMSTVSSVSPLSLHSPMITPTMSHAERQLTTARVH